MRGLALEAQLGSEEARQTAPERRRPSLAGREVRANVPVGEVPLRLADVERPIVGRVAKTQPLPHRRIAVHCVETRSGRDDPLSLGNCQPGPVEARESRRDD